MRLEFDLELLELALHKTIDLLQEEIFLLKNKHIADLEKLFSEKEDLLEYLTWYQPLILLYLKSHKNLLGSLNNLALRVQHLNEIGQKKIANKFPNRIIGNDLASSITIFSDKEADEAKIDLIFLNDIEGRATTIVKLIEDLTLGLEKNFHTINSQEEMNQMKIQFLQDFLKNPLSNSSPYVKEGQKKNTTYSGVDSIILVEEV